MTLESEKSRKSFSFKITAKPTVAVKKNLQISLEIHVGLIAFLKVFFIKDLAIQTCQQNRLKELHVKSFFNKLFSSFLGPL